MIDTSSAPVAGWYPDPADAASHRWWDGFGWTDHTRPLLVAAAPGAPLVVSLPAASAPSVPVSAPAGGASEPTFGSLEWRDRAAQANAIVDAAPAGPTSNRSATIALVAGIVIAGGVLVGVYFRAPIGVIQWLGSLAVIVMGIRALRRARKTESGRLRSIIAIGLGAVTLAPVLFPVLIDVVPTLLSFLI